MKWVSLIARVAVIVPMLASGAAQARVTVGKTDYHGWTSAYRLSNGTVELVIVPQIGRIMRYGFVGGPNVLWENAGLLGKLPDPQITPTDWMNFGGDKLWNAPQSRSGWPPDPVLDRGECAVTVLPGGRITMTGRISPKFGIRFRREITLSGNGTAVTLKNTLTNESAQPVEWAIWEVAQIDNPKSVLFSRSESGKFPDGYHLFSDFKLGPDMLISAGNEVGLRRNASQGSKIGTDAPSGWIKGFVADQEFTLFARRESGRTYTDDDCTQQIYVNADPLNYAEMELLGPIRQIRPGETTAFETHWSLKHRRP